MSQTTDSNSNGFQFRTEPIPASTGRGKWTDVIKRARQASAQGQALTWDCDGAVLNTARSTLYSHKSLLPGETVHITYAGTAIRVWITTEARS